MEARGNKSTQESHFHRGSITLAVGGIGNWLVDDTGINKSLVRPVITLRTLSVNSSATVVLDIPERAALGVVGPSIPLSVEEVLAVLESVAVENLQGPFTDVNRELAITANDGGLTTDGAVGPLRVDA